MLQGGIKAWLEQYGNDEVLVDHDTQHEPKEVVVKSDHDTKLEAQEVVVKSDHDITAARTPGGGSQK